MPSGQVKLDIILAGSDRLTATITRAQSSLNAFGKNANKAGSTAGNAFKKFGRAASGVRKNITQIHSAIFVMKQGVQALSGAWNAIKSGEEAANIAEAFRQVVDQTSASLNLFKRATLMTVDETTLQRTAIQFKNIGFSIKQTGELFELAKKQSMVTGKSFQSTAKRIAQAVSEGSAGQLAQLGIQVNLKDAYDAYALSVKKGVLDLNAWEKQNARITATMKELSENSALAKVDTTEFMTKAAELSTDWANIVSDLETEIAGMFNTLEEEGGLAVSNTRKVEQAFLDLAMGIGNARSNALQIGSAVGLASEDIEKMATSGAKLTKQQQQIAKDRGLGPMAAMADLAEWSGIIDAREDSIDLAKSQAKAQRELESIIIEARDKETEAERRALFEQKMVAAEKKKIIQAGVEFEMELLSRLEQEHQKAGSKNVIALKNSLRQFTNELDTIPSKIKTMYGDEVDFGEMIKGLGEGIDRFDRFGGSVQTRINEIATAMTNVMMTQEGWTDAVGDLDVERFNEYFDQFQTHIEDQMTSEGQYLDLKIAMSEFNESGKLAAKIARQEMELRLTSSKEEKKTLKTKITRNKIELEMHRMNRQKIVSAAQILRLESMILKAKDAGNIADMISFGLAKVKAQAELATAKAFDYDAALSAAMTGMKKVSSGRSTVNSKVEKSAKLLAIEMKWLKEQFEMAERFDSEKRKEIVLMEKRIQLDHLSLKQKQEIGKLQSKEAKSLSKSESEKIRRVTKEINTERLKIARETAIKMQKIDIQSLQRAQSVEELKLKIFSLTEQRKLDRKFQGFLTEESIQRAHAFRTEEIERQHKLDLEQFEIDASKKDADRMMLEQQKKLSHQEYINKLHQSEKKTAEDTAAMWSEKTIAMNQNLQISMQGIDQYSKGWGVALTGLNDIMGAIEQNTGNMQNQARFGIAASGRMFGAMAKDQKSQAAIRGAFELAAGFAAFPDPMGMGSHFLASTLFFAMAGKKGSKSKPTASKATGSFGGGGGTAGNVNTQSNITVNVGGFAIGSAAQMGKAIGSAVGEFEGSHSGRV